MTKLAIVFMILACVKAHGEDLPPASIRASGGFFHAEFGVELSIDKEKALPAYRTWGIYCWPEKGCSLEIMDLFATAAGGCRIEANRYSVSTRDLKVREFDSDKGIISFSWEISPERWGEADLKVNAAKNGIERFSAKAVLPASATDPIGRLPEGLRVWEWSIPLHSYEYKPDCRFIVSGINHGKAGNR